MMSVDKHLFWVLQDEDINNEGLFFPPDTPIGSINLAKSKKKLKRRHERQFKKLEEQQQQELCRFQKKFSERYDHQVYQNPAPPACEFINGMDFLSEFGADLASLVNVEVGSSQVQQNNSENGDDTKRRESKNMIEARKIDYSLAFRRRFRSGFESIENSHKQQVERLKSIQSEESAILDDLISRKTLNERKEKEAVEVSMKRARDLEQERLAKEQDKLAKERMKEKKHMKQKLQETQQEMQQQNQQQSQQQPPQQALQDRPKKKRKTLPNSPSTAQLNAPKQKESPKNKQKQKSKPKNVIHTPLREPPAVVSSAPNVQPTSQRGPTVAVSKLPPNIKKSKAKAKANTEQPTAPLFHSARPKKPTEPTVLTDTGAFTVKSKPNRVIIRSQNLGDPKDYDDAINSYKRTTENPVIRRLYKGKPHLFYKTQNGEILNVGPVSLIKPLVTAFLLSS